MSQERKRHSLTASGFSVAPSPLNPIKFRLGVVLLVGLVLWPVSERLQWGPVEQFALLGGYGVVAALWLVWRTRQVLRHELSKTVREGDDDGTQ